MDHSVLRPIRGRSAYRVQDGCWLWQGSTNSKGYPLRSIDGRVELVHRVITGATSGESVHHVCEQPPCVNPEHLQVVENEREHKAQHDDLLIDRIVELVGNGVCTTRAIHPALPNSHGTVSVLLTRATKYGVLRRVRQGVYEVAR